MQMPMVLRQAQFWDVFVQIEALDHLCRAFYHLILCKAMAALTQEATGQTQQS